MATDAANLDSAIKTAGAFVGGGLAGAQTIAGVARQPESQPRLMPIFFLTVGLVEAMYFINLAFMAMFVFVLGK